MFLTFVVFPCFATTQVDMRFRTKNTGFSTRLYILGHKLQQSGQFLKTLVQGSADGLQQIKFTHENHG